MEAEDAVAFVALCRGAAGRFGLWWPYRRYRYNNDRSDGSFVNLHDFRRSRAIGQRVTTNHYNDHRCANHDNRGNDAGHRANPVNYDDRRGSPSLLPVWGPWGDAG